MNVQVRFLTQFGAPSLADAGEWQVITMDWALPGGAREAIIRGSIPGFDTSQLQGFLDEHIGNAMEIYTEDGRMVWGGWVEKIVYHNGWQKMTCSIAEMVNRLIVHYPMSGLGTSPFEHWATTGWLENKISIDRFGAKEKCISIPQADSYLAQQALLRSFRALPKLPSFKIDVQPEVTETFFEFVVRGWWQRLDWILDAEERGKISHLAGGKSKYEIGNTAAFTQVAQSFRVTQPDFKLAQLWLRVSVVGDPQDKLQVAIYSDANGVPGSLLGLSDFPSNALDGGWAWVPWEMPNAIPLSLNSTYWLVIRRSGALNAAAYYVIESDDGLGYAGGQLKRWDGSSWQSLNQDLRFGLLARQDVAKLTEEMLQRPEIGAFLSGFVNWQSAEELVYRWRDYDVTCRQRLEEWLSSTKQFSAFIDTQRIFEIIPLPRQPQNPIRISTNIASVNPKDLLSGSGNPDLGRPVHFDFPQAAIPRMVQTIAWQKGKGFSWRFIQNELD